MERLASNAPMGTQRRVESSDLVETETDSTNSDPPKPVRRTAMCEKLGLVTSLRLQPAK